MKLRRTPLLVLAIVLLSGIAQPASARIDLSSLRDFLADSGVDIDLPPRAEEAVSRAIERVSSVLDRVLGDDTPDTTPDTPVTDTPDTSELIQSAIERARQAAADARARARARAQEAIDRVRDRVESRLDSLDIDLPSIDLTDTDLPGSLQDLVGDLDLPDVGSDVPSIVEEALDDLDLPGVEDIVQDALGQASGAVSDALDQAAEVVEEALEGPVGDVLSQVLDSEDPLETLLDRLPIDRLPEPAQTVIESVISRFASPVEAFSFQVAAVPEPGAASLLTATLLAGGIARRRR